ncbi:MAG: hypothetical protein OXM02_08905 [Bacteroidota bacterium]|nr:hypothetical protein [Bacteroidota bacterium]MDE2834626.1 hypothetical protein [Bacteroidota bacterium]MDE2956570.1 hypothetical protein [Bacteroidota bacterium]
MFRILKRLGLKGHEVHYIIKNVENMAGTRLEAQINRIKWMIGLGVAFPGILISVLTILTNG